MTNTLLDRFGSPAYTWLLAMGYVCFLLNLTFCGAVHGIPTQCLIGSTPDISPLLHFSWYQPVYCKIDDSDFPSGTREERGNFVGIAKNVGHTMAFRILTDDTKKVINRSNVRSAGIPLEYNLRLDPFCEESKQFIKSKSEKMQLYKLDESQSTSIEGAKLNQSERKTDSMPPNEPMDLVGQSFLLDTEDGENKLRAQSSEVIQDHDKATKGNPEHIQFRCSVNED